jgi:GMP synthase (glutamine-hydrolysing)
MSAGDIDVLVCQHIACEPPGVLEDVMHEHGWRLTRVELDEGEPVPTGVAFDAIVAMGGPMGAYDESAHPWLVKEQRLLREAINGGVPVFGVCLGAQLIAASMGARVYPGPAPEVGVLDVELTPAGREDPVMATLPGRFLTLQWHGDTFELPPGAVRLASSPAYANQAFRIGDATYAVQFHIEVTDAMAVEWGRVPAYAAALEAVRGPGSLAHLLAEFTQRAAEMRRLARDLFERWATIVEHGAHEQRARV